MADLSAIAAALSSLKAAKDIAQAMIDLRDGAAFQAKLIEFQSKIIDANDSAFAAQDERSTLLQKISDLEKTVANFEAWGAEKQRYELCELGPRAVALALKKSMSNGEPFHYICADCAANGKKFYLQQHISGVHFDQYKCKGCGFEIGIDKGTPNRWATTEE